MTQQNEMKHKLAEKNIQEENRKEMQSFWEI